MDDMKKHGEGLAASKKELEASSFIFWSSRDYLNMVAYSLAGSCYYGRQG